MTFRDRQPSSGSAGDLGDRGLVGNRRADEVQSPYRTSVPEVERMLGTTLATGLAETTASVRLGEVGPNSVERRRPNLAWALFRRLSQVLTLILIAAIGVSLAIGEVLDALLILIVLSADLALGLIYESFTQYKINLIQKQVPRVAEIVRSGAARLVPVGSVVPGDIVVLRAGERVPADIRLARVTGLRIDESVLTGEAGDQEKHARALESPAAIADQRNMAFAGTTVTVGHARGIVVATGSRSMLGQIAHRVVMAGWQVTPLEARLKKLGQGLGVGILVISALLFSLGMVRGEDPATMFRVVLTLAVAAIPEDLTFILTIALAIGSVRLLRRSAVVRHLTAAETLGDATVVATDKTGTLTTGQLTLRRVEAVADTWNRTGFREASAHPIFRRALIGAVVGTEAGTADDIVRGSALERAIRSSLADAGIAPALLRREFPLFASLAFDQRHRYRASLHNDPASPHPVVFVIGAPEILIRRCTAASDGGKSVLLTSELSDMLLERTKAAAATGTRVLAVAAKHLERDTRTLTHGDIHHLTFLALLHFDDPLRPGMVTSVRDLAGAGVRVILLTGDHIETANAVARAPGILRPAFRSVEGTSVDLLSDELLADTLRTVSVVARVDPLQKERMITALQRRGEVVAMVGDGVNDAVALRRADIGVAVASATDVAKDASDLVLLEGGLSALTAAVREGRRIRETVRTVLAFLFSTNLTEILAVTVSLLAALPLPFLPAQLLWINVVTDGVVDIALALEPATTRAGDPKPARRRGGIFRPRDLLSMLLTALAGLIPTMVVFQRALGATGDTAYAQTMAFVTLASVQLLTAFSYRSLEQPIIRLSPWGNPWLLVAEVVSFGLLVLAVHWQPVVQILGTVPLTPTDWATALVAALVGFLGVEFRKVLIPLFADRSGRQKQGTRGIASHGVTHHAAGA